LDSSEDESKPLKKGPKPAPKPLKQTKLNPKLALAELDMDAPAVFANPVAPELTVENAATRFILVPAAQFQAVGIGGWIARIKQVAKDRVQTTTIQFKDADGKYTTECFQFLHVAKSFKPLS